MARAVYGSSLASTPAGYPSWVTAMCSIEVGCREGPSTLPAQQSTSLGVIMTSYYAAPCPACGHYLLPGDLLAHAWVTHPTLFEEVPPRPRGEDPELGEPDQP